MTAKVIDFDVKGDDRGSLIALERGYNVPFDVKRVYYIFDTKEGVRRGAHAHRNLKQLAVCVKGSCRFLLDDGEQKRRVALDSPDKGLYLEGLIWREMYDFSPDCVLMVLADAFYDEKDYIREYDLFLQTVKKA